MKYILKKLIQSVITVFIILTVVFLALHATGNPVESLVSDSATLQEREALIKQLGLDKPLIVQYGIYLSDLLHGDLGTSYTSKRSVAEMIGERLPYTLLLAVAAILIAFVLAIIFGSLSAVKKNTWIDKVICGISGFFQATPIFFIAILALQLFGVKWKIFPVSGADSPTSFLLPSLLLGLGIGGDMTLLLRTDMIRTLQSNFIRFDILKGLPEFLVIGKHALRSSVSALLSMSAVTFSYLISGSVVVESVFAWPGIGTLSYNSVIARDFPVVQAIVLLYSFITIGLSFAVDIVSGIVDPRVRNES